MTSRGFAWRAGPFLIIFFWVLVCLGNFPAPFIDDAWYIGPALNLVQHGVFTNTLCESMATVGSTDMFLVSMPLHAYVLAGWLWVFGINTISIRLFYILLALLISLLVYRLLPRNRFSWLAALVVCVATYGLLGGMGLRQDSLGIFFTLLGFDAWRAEKIGPFFWKNLSLSLAVITLPTAGLLSMLLSVAALGYRLFVRGATVRESMPFVVATGAAYLISFLVLLACIHGQLHALLVCLGKNSHLSAKSMYGRFHLVSALGISKWIVVQAAFLALIAFEFAKPADESLRKERRFHLTLALFGFLCLGYASFSSSTGAHIWAFGCLLAGLYVLLFENGGFLAWSAYALILLVAAFGHAHVAVQGLLAGPPIAPERRTAILAEVAQLHPDRLYFDAYAFREVYDYRPPANSYCFETSNVLDGWTDPSRAEEMRKAVAVVSTGASFPTSKSPNAGKLSRPLVIFGVTFWGVSRNPYDLEVIDNR